MAQDIVTTNWEDAYKKGKYGGDAPIKFVSEIIDIVNAKLPKGARGFYPGCGNGRNFIPLAEAGLDIAGNDISEAAIAQLLERLPNANVTSGEFLSMKKQMYDYILSIQLFQHGNDQHIKQLFDKTAEILAPGGLFFLRVNSIHTQIIEDHDIVERSDAGGFTIAYGSGQKTGQNIHFYSAEEIHELTKNTYDIIVPLREEFMPRADGTFWAQWETVLQLKQR